MIKRPTIRYSIWWGAFASVTLFVMYLSVISFVSGPKFAADQLSEFWPFVVSLSVGFGVQVGLYLYLKEIMKRKDVSGAVTVATGATSTVAMISCCAHYLVNILPVLGATGIVALTASYQTELFWLGLAANMAGVAFIGGRIYTFYANHKI